jgi:hypothetical protein
VELDDDDDDDDDERERERVQGHDAWCKTLDAMANLPSRT